jgi:hypothetical protein
MIRVALAYHSSDAAFSLFLTNKRKRETISFARLTIVTTYPGHQTGQSNKAFPLGNSGIHAIIRN